MTQETEVKLTPPLVFWAQRDNVVYLNVALEDCLKPEIKLEKDKLYFKGLGGTDRTEHEVTIEFFDDIVVDDSKYSTRARGTEFILVKAVGGPYWKRLLKSDKKCHWLRVDFNKWKDEDDSDNEGAGFGGGGGGGGLGGADTDFDAMMRNMGGLGGSAGGLGDLGGKDDEEDEESDDDDIPDLAENVEAK